MLHLNKEFTHCGSSEFHVRIFERNSFEWIKIGSNISQQLSRRISYEEYKIWGFVVHPQCNVYCFNQYCLVILCYFQYILNSLYFPDSIDNFFFFFDNFIKCMQWFSILFNSSVWNEYIYKMSTAESTTIS